MLNNAAVGAKPIIGAPLACLEAEFGNGGRYDPDRDVLNFWPHMLRAILLTMRERGIPALAILDRQPELETATLRSIQGLFNIFTCPVADWEALVAQWQATCPPEGLDVVLQLVGRAALQFYVECARDRCGAQWPGMEAVIQAIGWRPRTPWWRRVLRWFRRKG